MKIQFASAAAAAFLLTLTTGCAGDDSDSGGSGSASASGSDTDGTGNDSMTSAGPGGETTASTTATTSATAGDDPTDPLPDGSDCTSNEQCISGKCFYVAILGGICGECLTDEDCPDGGCSLPIPDLFPTGPKGAVCNTGELGDGCDTTESCQDGLVCSELIVAEGILTAAGCSECDSDADCTDGQLCSPTYDIGNLSGARVCVDPGSVQNGEGCDHAGSGDDACNSGHCFAYDFMNLGIITVGVCGECKTSADCDAGQSCQDPDLDTDTFEVTPPTCG